MSALTCAECGREVIRVWIDGEERLVHLAEFHDHPVRIAGESA